MALRVALLSLVATAFAKPFESENVARDACNVCNPQGATGTNPPSVGNDLSSLYLDVLASVKDIHFSTRSVASVEARADGFCCAETLDCVNVQNLNIPMCYDKFTTNFAFADRSYGSLTTGNYTQGSAEVNLLTGQYSKDGQEGNIYDGDSAAKPNTATLSIPPQWTATGVGSAIPATAIVGSVTAAPTAQSSSASGTTGSQSTTGSATESTSGEVASATESHGAAIKDVPSFLIMGLGVLLYAA